MSDTPNDAAPAVSGVAVAGTFTETVAADSFAPPTEAGQVKFPSFPGAPEFSIEERGQYANAVVAAGIPVPTAQTLMVAIRSMQTEHPGAPDPRHRDRLEQRYMQKYGETEGARRLAVANREASVQAKADPFFAHQYYNTNAGNSFAVIEALNLSAENRAKRR